MFCFFFVFFFPHLHQVAALAASGTANRAAPVLRRATAVPRLTRATADPNKTTSRTLSTASRAVAAALRTRSTAASKAASAIKISRYFLSL